MNDANDRTVDVLGLGCAAVDDLLYVTSFPRADRKAPVLRRVRKCGGLTGTALVAASRLGALCAYGGCLGPDEFSRHVENNLRGEGIDVSRAPREPDAGVVTSTIVVGEDTGSRNIFFETPAKVGAHPLLPSEEILRSARVLFIDHLGMAGNLRAVGVARAAGIPVVADFEDAAAPEFAEVLAGVGHLILSQEFACQVTGRSSAAGAGAALWGPGRELVAVTCGAGGLWWVGSATSGVARHLKAFDVKAVDTTGCGDVFHGAYAASLARGEGVEERLRYAAAAAALKAARGEIPRRTELEVFLREQGFDSRARPL